MSSGDAEPRVCAPAERRAPDRGADAEARIAHIRAERWIQNTGADRVLAYLHDALEPPRRTRMENLLLVGESGMGKAMLIRKFERQVTPAFDEASGTQRRPVVVMLMPYQPSEAQFFDQLLRALHAPSPRSFCRNYPVGEPVVRLLSELGTRVVVIDELNSVLAGTARQQRIFLQLLRFLSNELRLAFVGVGVPEARHALLSDSQLRSRFSDVELPPWSAGEELRAFVMRLTWSLPLRLPSPVDSARLRRLLVDRTCRRLWAMAQRWEEPARAALSAAGDRVGSMIRGGESPGSSAKRRAGSAPGRRRPDRSARPGSADA